jgi:uncharacterized protein (DUF2062 family)
VTQPAGPPEAGGFPGVRRPGRFTALLHRYRTEGNTPIRQAFSIGLGLYIGASPFIGFHLLLIIFFGWLFGLNRLKAYLAAHISMPVIAPVLYATEIQIGAWLRTGHVYSTAMLGEIRLQGLALDVLIGSVVVGGVLALAGTIVTYAVMSGRGRDPHEVRLVDARPTIPHRRFVHVGVCIRSWKWTPSIWASCGTGRCRQGILYDLGCGQGLMLSLLSAARDRYGAGDWPAGWPPPPSASSCEASSCARASPNGRKSSAVWRPSKPRPLRLVTAAVPAALLVDVLHLMPVDARIASSARSHER